MQRQLILGHEVNQHYAQSNLHDLPEAAPTARWSPIRGTSNITSLLPHPSASTATGTTMVPPLPLLLLGLLLPPLLLTCTLNPAELGRLLCGSQAVTGTAACGPGAGCGMLNSISKSLLLGLSRAM